MSEVIDEIKRHLRSDELSDYEWTILTMREARHSTELESERLDIAHRLSRYLERLAEQHKALREAENILKQVSHCDSISYLRRHSERDYGLDFTEALEMAYENILVLAKSFFKGKKKIAKTATKEV